MRNMAFVIWLVGWSLAVDIGQYFEWLRGERFTDSEDAHFAVFWVLIWVIVGCLVYERKETIGE